MKTLEFFFWTGLKMFIWNEPMFDLKTKWHVLPCTIVMLKMIYCVIPLSWSVPLIYSGSPGMYCKNSFLFVSCRKYWQQVQVVDLVASVTASLLHRPKLCKAPLGKILHVVLPSVHSMDRHLLLLHGLDGEPHLNCLHLACLCCIVMNNFLYNNDNQLTCCCCCCWSLV